MPYERAVESYKVDSRLNTFRAKSYSSFQASNQDCSFHLLIYIEGRIQEYEILYRKAVSEKKRAKMEKGEFVFKFKKCKDNAGKLLLNSV